MNKPNFTVIIPLYNKAEHILRTLASVERQKYPAAEIIIIDDGSTDNGVEIVAAANIENLKLIKQTNSGVSSARNKGVALAQYEYVAFLDADDEWLPLYLEETAGLIMKYPESALYGTRYQIIEEGDRYVDAKIHIHNMDPTGELLDDFFDIASKGDLPFTMSSVTMKKSLFEAIGNFPLGEPLGEDQDLFCRAALHTPIAYSNNIHSLYHREAQNRACINSVPENECPFSIRLKGEAMQSGRVDKLKTSMLRYTAAHLCHIAKLNIHIGRFSHARALLKDPRCKLKPKHLYGLYSWSWVKQIQSNLGRFF